MASRSLSATLCVLVIALAGCAGGGGGGEPKEDLPDAYDDVEASDTTGSIVGVVINDAIMPIAGVTVALNNPAQTATTDDQGAFVFNGLEPGDYFLVASKLGYQSIQQSATVVAGERQPPLVKIVLASDPSTVVFATHEIWEGFVSCAATVGAAGGYAGGHICDESMGSRFIHEFPFVEGRFPTYIQDEMVWDNTQPLGDSLSPGYYRSGLTDWKTVTGPSPLLLNATADELHEEEETRGANMTGVTIRVFPGHGDGAVVTTNQKFVIYHTVFYGFTPRDGWLFTLDGPCQPAEACA